jgi:hypothetical protein
MNTNQKHLLSSSPPEKQGDSQELSAPEKKKDKTEATKSCPPQVEEIVLKLLLTEGFLYRVKCVGLPQTCKAWNQIWKETLTSLPLIATFGVRSFLYPPTSR